MSEAKFGDNLQTKMFCSVSIADLEKVNVC